jgi:putative ABC transport system ATP-binding protein
VIGDVDLATLDDNELTRLRRDRIGFVFQAFNLVPTLTAAENIVLPLSIAGRQADGDWLETVISTLHLGDRLHHRPSQLSGGQQQRVAAARALITRPDLVFADEPSGNLDSRSGAQLLEFLRKAVDEFQQTIVLVTHDPSAAAQADRIVFLADGRVIDEMASPSTDRVIDRLHHLEA